MTSYHVIQFTYHAYFRINRDLHFVDDKQEVRSDRRNTRHVVEQEVHGHQDEWFDIFPIEHNGQGGSDSLPTTGGVGCVASVSSNVIELARFLGINIHCLYILFPEVFDIVNVVVLGETVFVDG